jgi:hypothetical protein
MNKVFKNRETITLVLLTPWQRWIWLGIKNNYSIKTRKNKYPIKQFQSRDPIWPHK